MRQHGTNEEFFRELESEVFEAHVKRDVAALDDMYAVEFFSTNADDRVLDNTHWLEMVKIGTFSVDRIDADEFRLRIYGSTAVITGRSVYHKFGRVIYRVRHT